MFTRSYARRELWDLLDSMIFYRKETCDRAPGPHMIYRCLSVLVEAAYALYPHSL